MPRDTIAFYVDLVQKQARHVAKEATQAAHEAGFAVAICDSQNDVLQLADTGAEVPHARFLIAIGGDGTLLRAARIAYPYDIPLLGINTGRLGFLTEFEIDGPVHMKRDLTDLLKNADDIVIEKRAMLEARLDDGRKFVALNDIVVRKGGASRIETFRLELDGEHVADLPGDGIVVATATGSTAYFLSAGGPIIAPSVDAFGIAALLPHTLFSRPLIVPTSATIAITLLDSLRANLDADGEDGATLSPEDRVTVCRAEKPIRFARREPLRYFSRLEQKLRWGVSIRSTSR